MSAFGPSYDFDDDTTGGSTISGESPAYNPANDPANFPVTNGTIYVGNGQFQYVDANGNPTGAPFTPENSTSDSQQNIANAQTNAINAQTNATNSQENVNVASSNTSASSAISAAWSDVANTAQNVVNTAQQLIGITSPQISWYVILAVAVVVSVAIYSSSKSSKQ